MPRVALYLCDDRSSTISLYAARGEKPLDFERFTPGGVHLLGLHCKGLALSSMHMQAARSKQQYTDKCKYY
eukprot:19986-Heterococcus_DN1.PRE.2